MRTAIVIAYYRGKVAKPMEGLGAMVAVGLDPDEVTSKWLGQHMQPQSLRSNARQLWMVRLPRPEGYLQGERPTAEVKRIF
jgi:hypothetical protein